MCGGIIDYYEVVGFIVKTLFSYALDDDLYVCACVIYIIWVGCLVKVDEVSFCLIFVIFIEVLLLIDVCWLLIVVCIVKDVIEVIGSVDDEFWALIL